MSHNAHFFRIKADTKEQAVAAVTNYVEDGYEFVHYVDYGQPLAVLDTADGVFECFAGYEGWNTEDWCTTKLLASYLDMTPDQLVNCTEQYKGAWCEEELTDVMRPVGRASKTFIVVYDFHT